MSDKKYENIAPKGEIYEALRDLFLDLFEEVDADWVIGHVRFDLSGRHLTIRIDKINDQDRVWLVDAIEKEAEL